jgi:hypothetical protein
MMKLVGLVIWAFTFGAMCFAAGWFQGSGRLLTGGCG